eukprot:jgi/Psemu1/15712/gm1.15712_g
MLYSVFKQATRTSVQNILRRRSFATTTTPAFVKAKRANAKAGQNLTANWLADPSTYPIIVVMGGALTMVLGVSASCLMYNPDVQIKKTGSVIRPPVE